MAGLGSRIAALLFATMLALPVRAAEPAEPVDPDLNMAIAAVAAFDGQLWVLGANGAVVSFALTDGTRHLRIARAAIGLQKLNGRLLVLAPAARPQTFDLLEWKSGAFASTAPFTVRDDEKVLALAAIADHPAVVTSQGIRWFDGTAWQMTVASLGVRRPFGDSPASAGAPSSARALYLGYNFGEWGGGLKRVDLKTGKVTPPERPSDRGSMSGGMLSGQPISAIIADPANRDCVLAAAGLVHFFASGSIERVCGEKVSTVFEYPGRKPGEKLHNNEAFFGLVPATGGYWAVSTGAVYRFGAGREPERHPIDKAELWHGLYVNRDIAGVIVVYTELNRRFSVNSGTPLVAPLD